MTSREDIARMKSIPQVGDGVHYVNLRGECRAAIVLDQKAGRTAQGTRCVAFCVRVFPGYGKAAYDIDSALHSPSLQGRETVHHTEACRRAAFR